MFSWKYPDNIEGIFDGYKEMGLLSKFGGGIGWDWNKVRSRSSVIDNNINAGGTTPLKIKWCCCCQLGVRKRCIFRTVAYGHKRVFGFKKEFW